MKRCFVSSILTAFITGFFITPAFASTSPDAVHQTQVMNKAYRMQIPFIENRGQVGNDEVSFYAKTFGGTLFVEKDGTLTYSLPFNDKESVVIKEVLTDSKVEVKGLEPSPTQINYFKGNDQSKWKTNIPSFNSVSLGEVYKGIELTLKAYGKNVEKLFKVLPSANPELIKVTLQGAKELKVNDKGELEVLTDHGPINFTKPLAYQEINGKRVEVEVAYRIEKAGVERKKSGVRNQESEFKRSTPTLQYSITPYSFYNSQTAICLLQLHRLLLQPLLPPHHRPSPRQHLHWGKQLGFWVYACYKRYW
jgi:hypothetical protein